MARTLKIHKIKSKEKKRKEGEGKLAILMQLSHRQFTRKNNNNLQQ